MIKGINLFFSDLLYFPKVGLGAWRVWKRNFLYFKYSISASISWIFIEPILYLLALGFGLGQFVGTIEGMSYAQFIAPALIASSGMFVSFFEGAYGTYTKLSRQNTFHTIILTPVSIDEVTLGEIFWATAKGLFSVIGVALVMVTLGLMDPLRTLVSLPVMALMCWVFAGLGVWMAGLSKSYEWFTYAQSGLITPMALFCGTYFPLSYLPDPVLLFSYSMPLTHGLMGMRLILSGEMNHVLIINISYLIFAGIFLTNLSAAKMERKVIL